MFRSMRIASLPLLALLTLSGFQLYTPIDESEPHQDPAFVTTTSPWADSVYASLDFDERIAQLFMVAAYSNRDQEHLKSLKQLVNKHGIGGLIFFQGGPVRQALMTNELQSLSKVPLLLGMDAEWGLAMRLDSTIKYPWQMTLGAIQDNYLVYEMGSDIGEQLNRLGVHVNFAPVVDVNVNPRNPIIKTRSFGENRDNVAEKGIAYMKGMQHQRVMANAKHFPGHGDTDKDSHKTLPIVIHTKERLDSIELYPFIKLMDSGLSSVMVAHLYVPAYVKTYNMATTLSPEVVNGLLKDTIGFKGLVFTDALNMKGVSAKYKPGEVDVKALIAGNDILLFAEDVPKAISEIKKAVKRGEISEDEINKRCLKVLKAKEWVGLDHFNPIDTNHLVADLNKREHLLHREQLIEASMTLLENKNEIIPFQRLDTLKIASLAIGEAAHGPFQEMLGQYTQVDTFSIKEDPTASKQKHLLDQLEGYNTVVISLHKSDKRPYGKQEFTGNVQDLVQVLRLKKKVILTVFANPYSLLDFRSLDHLDGVLLAYQNNEAAQKYAAQLLFGGVAASGRLPVTLSAKYKEGYGLDSRYLMRLNYRMPESLKLYRGQLDEIDSIVMEGIREEAYPGAQVLVAKDGSVIYNKSFGHHTYDAKRPVRNDDLYDLASITKIAATLPAVMELDEEDRIDLDYSLCDYLPEIVDSTDYANLSLRDILTHQAGLVAWIPFYKQTLVNGQPRYDVYSLSQSDLYSIPVTDKLYMNHHFRDSIMVEILKREVDEDKEYRYSDIGYYFLKEIVEKLHEDSMNGHLDRELYSKIGMSNTSYLPRERFSKNRIIPTEDDKTFRKQLIHGDVHDPGAAMLGGVGGHAGLFSNANDMAKLMQMYLNGGSYGEERFFSEDLIAEYTRCQFCENENRRGVGFDKPLVDEEGGPTCSCVSPRSFGHSGFTGTYAWADPDEGLVYVFLSNRVYPKADNKKLIKMNIRTRIQEVIYEAIEETRRVELTDSISK